MISTHLSPNKRLNNLSEFHNESTIKTFFLRPSIHPYIHPSYVNQCSLLRWWWGGTGIYSVAQGGLIGLRCSVFPLRANSNIEATCVRAQTCVRVRLRRVLLICTLEMSAWESYIYFPSSLGFLLPRHVGTHHIFQPLSWSSAPSAARTETRSLRNDPCCFTTPNISFVILIDRIRTAPLGDGCSTTRPGSKGVLGWSATSARTSAT